MAGQAHTHIFRSATGWCGSVCFFALTTHIGCTREHNSSSAPSLCFLYSSTWFLSSRAYLKPTESPIGEQHRGFGIAFATMCSLRPCCFITGGVRFCCTMSCHQWCMYDEPTLPRRTGRCAEAALHRLLPSVKKMKMRDRKSRDTRPYSCWKM